VVLGPRRGALAAPVRPRWAAADVAGLETISTRLLDRALVELADADRPLGRHAAGRCVAHFADAVEALALCRSVPVAEREVELRRARRATLAARHALAQVQRSASVAPTVLRELGAGVEVLRRRLDELLECEPAPEV